MNKEELINKLSELKDWISNFQKRKMTIINIPPNKIKIDKKYLDKDLDNNPKLKSALFSMAYRSKSKKQEEIVYNNKSNLKQKYWMLENYIRKLWTNPWINWIDCYWAYFLNDIWTTEDNNYKSILSDINIILWKLNLLSQKELDKLFEINNKNYWKLLNPIYWVIFIFIVWWKHKIISWILLFLIWVIFTIFITDSIKPLTDKITKPFSEFLSWSLNN